MKLTMKCMTKRQKIKAVRRAAMVGFLLDIFADDLSKQPEETVDFIHGLLKGV